jgi:ribonuclease-3
MRADLDSLAAALEHRFANPEILDRALTHRSHVNESAALAPGQADRRRHNEQLEFLGDAVLGFLVSDLLIDRFPELPEGRLSKLRAHLVSARRLLEVAQALDLGRYLQIGRGEEMTGGRGKPTLLENAVEALIAALYLDGGIPAAARFVERWVLDGPGFDLPSAGAPESVTADFKSALQELARSRNLPQPRYVTVRERGPEHSKTFTVEARVGKDYVAQAEGLTKKSAAQRAAREIFEKLQQPCEASENGRK